MAFDHRHVIEAQFQQLANERAAAVAEYEANRISEDSYGTMTAAERILQADVQRAALDRIAQNFIAGQQQPQGNQFGLNQDEIDIANSMVSGDRTITNEERQRVYAMNRDRLRHMRATGQYRDDQGRR